MKIITVNREFGSGGRELGKRLADYLGISYYDKEIISAIAEKSSMDAGYIDRVMEHGITRQYPIRFSRTFSLTPALAATSQASALLVEQHRIIKELAEKGDCVMIGRGADAVLQQYHPFKLFVYAEMEVKIRRCQERASPSEHLAAKEMERKIRQIDKARKTTHDIYASSDRDDKKGYHLCINTTEMGIKELIPAVAAYAESWFERNTL